ncbi:MAG: tRNA pseudouridine(55) synthase TruB [Acidiferrobacterales bacterium]
MDNAVSVPDLRRGARNTRDVSGILLFDKPRGMSSNRALQDVRNCLQARKAGHTGSLDPLASGLLPLCFGEATKLSRFLLEADKTYQTVFRLGQETATYDAEGEVLRSSAVTSGRREIEQALDRFVGEIEQVPPAYSAIKQGGQPLYKLARAGVEVKPPARRVTVREIHVLNLQGDCLELEITCSKGTYIRSLAHDLGRILGCGAHVAELRRLALGGFRVEGAVGLDELRKLPGPDERATLLIPGDRAAEQLPRVDLSANAAFYLCQGQVVSTPHGRSEGLVRLYEVGGRFLGIGQVLADGRVAPDRLISVPERSDNTKESG